MSIRRDWVAANDDRIDEREDDRWAEGAEDCVQMVESWQAAADG
jgi:hypothetical protein